MDDPKDLQGRIARAMSLPLDRRIYSNGFIITITPSDVCIGLENNREPLAMINMTIPVAKELSLLLRETISNFEQNNDYQFPPLRELEERIEKKNAKSKEN
jgi:hypothetical protein